MNQIHALQRKIAVYEQAALFSLANMSPSFGWSFNSFLTKHVPSIASTALSKEELNNWYEKNKNVLDNSLEYIWAYFALNNLMSSHIKHDKYRWITPTYSPPANMLYSEQEAILLPSGRIPKLWFWIGERAQIGDESKLSKDLAHNYFVVDAIKSLYNLDLNDITLAKISKFVEENMSTINDIKAQIKSRPQYLGAGSDGIVFDIGGNRVLKIFRDIDAFMSAKDALTRLHKNPALAKTEAMIYDVDLLGRYNGNDLYYYVIEKMKPINQTDEYIIDIFRDIIRKFSKVILFLKTEEDINLQFLKSKIDDPTYLPLIRSKVDKIVNIMVDKVLSEMPSHDKKIISNMEKKFALKPDWFKIFAEEVVMKYLTGRTDLHTGNLGITEYGVLRYFDPSFQQWNSEININF